jgi:hypothetical protein
MGSFSANRRACEVDPNGAWGGEHIRMEVTDSGADIEFDCARGSISQRLELDDKGTLQDSGYLCRWDTGACRG